MPLMFVVLGISNLEGQLITQFVPLVRVGRPPGVVVSLGLLGLTIIGFFLWLWRRPAIR